MIDDNANEQFVDFPTTMLTTAIFMGNDTDGAVQFTFFTPPGFPHLRTILIPTVTRKAIQALQAAAANIPSASAILGLDVPRRRAPKGNTSTHFGQDYPPDVLQALGVLMVRINLLEVNLINMLAAVGNLTQEQASSLFYSTISMKARLDMIQGLAGASDLTDYTGKLVEKAINKARAVAGRRNDLMHGQWSFVGDNFEVKTMQPNSAQKIKKQIVTAKSVYILATDYRIAGTLAEGCVSPILHERNMARNAASIPLSGEANCKE